MIRLIGGALLSAIVLFAWWFVFWGISGLMYHFLHPVPNPDEVVQVLQKDDLPSGNYLIPFPDREAVSGTDPERRSEFFSRHVRGPLVEIIYRKEGMDPTDVQPLVAGFCQYLAASLMAGVLLVLAQPGLQRYPARVVFVALAGVFASVAVTLEGPTWFHHPWPAALYEAGYQIVGWLLAGMVLGLVIRPAPVKPAAPPSAAPPAPASPDAPV